MSDDPVSWRRLCGLAVELVGGQAQFRVEANILKRLMRYGPEEVEHMIQGAKLMRWSSLRSLGSQDGLGRRMALAKYWESENRKPARQSLESLGSAFKRLGLV